jgi:hypothetical protein
MQSLREAPPEQVHERQRAEREQGQQRMDAGHDRRHRHHDHEVAERERDQRDEVLDLQQIAVRARHQLAGLRAVVVAEVQAQHLREHALAQGGLGPAPFAEA